MVFPEFVIETDPTPEQIQYLEDRLYEFNSQTTGITDGEGLAVFIRDEQRQIVAGICGHTWGGCCEIKQFWIEASRRRQGVGNETAPGGRTRSPPSQLQKDCAHDAQFSSTGILSQARIPRDRCGRG